MIFDVLGLVGNGPREYYKMSSATCIKMQTARQTTS